LPYVVHELSRLGIYGMTATKVKGVGVQGGVLCVCCTYWLARLLSASFSQQQGTVIGLYRQARAIWGHRIWRS